eukprot:11207207-Lingulodinium_polyedra.AAC.1
MARHGTACAMHNAQCATHTAQCPVLNAQCSTPRPACQAMPCRPTSILITAWSSSRARAMAEHEHSQRVDFGNA